MRKVHKQEVLTNFRRMEIKAYTKEEAKEQSPWTIMKDATQAWRLAGKPYSDKDMKAFCLDYLKKWTQMVPGLGCMIVYENGVPNKKHRPFKIVNKKNKKGIRKYTRSFIAVDDDTNELLFWVQGEQPDAVKLAEKTFFEGKCKGSMTVFLANSIYEGEPVAFTAEFAPSTISKEGTYIIFGVDKF